MLSQFKFNLAQAISCISIHREELLATCQDSLEGLDNYLKQILPPKLLSVLNGVVFSSAYTSISEFFEYLERLQTQMIDQDCTPTKQSFSWNRYSQNNIERSQHVKLKNRHVLKRFSIRTELTPVKGNSEVESGLDIGIFNNWVFQEYKKVDEGSKKLGSFQEKQAFKNTLNYHKIIRFLKDISVKINADSRLKVLVAIKKNSKQSNYITKEEFILIYGQIKRLLDITQDIETDFRQAKRSQLTVKRKTFSRKFDARSQRKISHSDFLDSSVKSVYKRSPEKPKNQKSYIQNAIEKMKIKVLNWEHLTKIKEGNMFRNILVPQIEFKVESDQDAYYLREFHNSSAVKEKQITSLSLKNPSHTRKGKSIQLPSLRLPNK